MVVSVNMAECVLGEPDLFSYALHTGYMADRARPLRDTSGRTLWKLGVPVAQSSYDLEHYT